MSSSPSWRRKRRPPRRSKDSAAAVVDEPLTCTLQEAADLIGVSRTTVDRLLQAGLIYERKVPGVRRRLISRRSVVAFIDG